MVKLFTDHIAAALGVLVSRWHGWLDDAYLGGSPALTVQLKAP